MLDQLLTVEDVADRYKIERHTAARMMKQMQYLPIGRRIFVKESDLAAYERDHKVYPVIKYRRSIR